MIAYCYSPALERASDELPSNPARSSHIHRLISAYKLLQHENIQVLCPRPASAADLRTYHTPRYVDVLMHPQGISESIAAEYGLEYDCPIFDGLSEYVCQTAGASIDSARALTRSDDFFNIVINWDGGRHHAKKASASGFCYVADAVLAIHELRKRYAQVVYVDLDIHHGDGVESAFVYSDKVLTISLHRYGAGFFPQTGSHVETGKGKGKGFAMNVPLARGLSDGTMLHVVREIVLPAIHAFTVNGKSTAMVIQCGVDSLAYDPIKEWNLSIRGYCATIHVLQQCADKLHLKTMYLGGGGYNTPLASRCYASITALLLHIPLADQIPEHSLWCTYSKTNYELCSDAKIIGMRDENDYGVLDRIKEALL